jgi:hypothetical protein
MIGYAVIAAQHGGSNQAKQLLRLHIQNTLLVRASVQREKPLNAQIARREYALIHAFPITPEFVKIVQRYPTTCLTAKTA